MSSKKTSNPKQKNPTKIHDVVKPNDKGTSSKITFKKNRSIIKDQDIQVGHKGAPLGAPKLELSDELSARLRNSSKIDGAASTIEPQKPKKEKIIKSNPETDNNENNNDRDEELLSENEEGEDFLDEADAEIGDDRKLEPKTEKEDDTSKEDKDQEAEKPDLENERGKEGEKPKSQDALEEGIVNELAQQAADSKKQKKESEDEEAKNEKLESLIEQKAYEVPIGQLTRKRNTRLSILALFLLVAGGAIALNFMIDAGMVDIGIEPLTDFITQ